MRKATLKVRLKEYKNNNLWRDYEVIIDRKQQLGNKIIEKN